MVAENIRIRRLRESDSLEELTSLLHRAYKELSDKGLNITAADQSVETTGHRASDGVCFVAESLGKLVGTATLVTVFGTDSPPLYLARGTAVLGQFGVDPEWRGQKVGRMLMDAVEQEALEQGFRTLALDTPQPAAHLIEYYQRRGFSLVGTHQWSGKTYVSALMSKDLFETK